VGRAVEVLVEGPSRTDPSRLRGRSRHNKVVNFGGLGSPGELVDVEITGATSQTLSGHERILSRAAGR
jgi:tRNA-2-methylthio-N6-dimethylallyladenosine synthase